MFLELSHGQWAGNGTGAVAWSTALFDASAIQCIMPTLWLVTCSLPIVRTLQSMVDAGTITVLVARSGIVDYCGPSMYSLPSLQLTISVQPGAQLAVLTTAVESTGTATAAIATVSAVAGMGAAGSAQTLAVLGSLSCSPPTAKKQTSSLRYMLSPFVDFGYSAMVLGNAGIVASVAIGQGLLILILVYIRRYPRLRALGTARFPSMSLTVAGFLYQGTVFAGFQLVQLQITLSDFLVGSAGILLCVLMPLGTTWYIKQSVLHHLSFRLYPHAMHGAPPLTFLSRILLPRGFWDSRDVDGNEMEYIERFGSAISSFCDHRAVLVHAYPHVFVFFVNLFAVLIAAASCKALYAVLIAVFVACASFVVWFTPHRSPFLNISGGSSFVVLAVVCILQWAQSANVDDDKLPLASTAVNLLQLMLIVLRAVYDTVIARLHKKWIKQRTLRDEKKASNLGDLLHEREGEHSNHIDGGDAAIMIWRTAGNDSEMRLVEFASVDEAPLLPLSQIRQTSSAAVMSKLDALFSDSDVEDNSSADDESNSRDDQKTRSSVSSGGTFRSFQATAGQASTSNYVKLLSDRAATTSSIKPTTSREIERKAVVLPPLLTPAMLDDL